MAYTVAYQPAQEGFTSFFSFYPEMAVGLGNFMYSFNNGQIYKHNIGSPNSFYDSIYESKIITFFNESPTELKLYKTVSIDGVYLPSNVYGYSYVYMNTKEYSGIVSQFERKEGIDYAYIRTVSSPDNMTIGIGSLLSQSTNKFNVFSNDDSYTPSLDGTEKLLYISPNTSTVNYIGPISAYEKSGSISTYYTSSTSGTVPSGAIICVSKNQTVESYGLRGTYMILDLNMSANTEIFSISTEVFKSFP